MVVQPLIRCSREDWKRLCAIFARNAISARGCGILPRQLGLAVGQVSSFAPRTNALPFRPAVEDAKDRTDPEIPPHVGTV